MEIFTKKMWVKIRILELNLKINKKIFFVQKLRIVKTFIINFLSFFLFIAKKILLNL